MRKKYLSALLFGALLFASAGTFTSCKDYDDDINNLQEQINTINTTLSELKSQIGNNGVSSVTFDEATGVLTVVDGNGTKSYNISTSATAMVEAEIKDGKLYINDEEIGAVVGEVTVVDGKLMVDGKEVASLGGESNVLLVKNEDDQTYTLTVGDTSVVLPANADATTVPSVEITANTGHAVTTFNVAWGVAEKEITFGNTKIAAGDLLLGGMTQFGEVTVKPVTYDLSTQKLALVDIDGNIAKVDVIPSTEEAEGTTSRAMVSNNGVWTLNLKMQDSVTEENIATAFTKKVNGVDQNLKYALTINGTRVTGYEFVIDTQTKNESDNNTQLKDGDFGKDTYWNEVVVKAGTTVVTLSDFTNYNSTNYVPKVVDSYLVFEGSDAVRPEAAGVEVDGMTITAPATATGNYYRATLYTLDVTGTTTKHTVNIYIKASTISAVDQVDMVEVAISKDGKFGINFGDIFSKLDANSIQSIYSCELTTANPDFFAIKSKSWYENEYYVAKREDIAFYKKSDKKDKVDINSNDLRSITYAEVTLSKLSNGHYQTLANNLDNIYGIFDLQLTLTDGANEIKKIVVPVKVVAPEFSDYYKANSYAGWDANGNLNKTLTGNVKLEPTVLYLDNEGKALTAGDALNVLFDKFKNTADTEIAANSTLAYRNVLKAIDGKDGRYTLGITQLSATATATVATVENTTGDSKNITVKTQFKVNLSQQFTGAKLVYFNNSVAQEKASVFATEDGTDFIQGFYQSQKANATTGATAKYSGLAIQYAGQNRAPITEATINGIALTLDEMVPTEEGDINYTIETGTGSQGGELDLTNEKAIQFKDKIELGAGGKLNVTFVDNLGIESSASIEYVKTNTVQAIK